MSKRPALARRYIKMLGGLIDETISPKGMERICNEEEKELLRQVYLQANHLRNSLHRHLVK